MNENLPTNVQLDTAQNGSVTFATDVVATMASIAANEIEGVASMHGGSQGVGLADILTRRGQNARNMTRGVRVELSGKQVSINVSIVIDYGMPVPEVASAIQENVKKNIETMTGLTVTGVDVHVQGVSFERENRAAAEIEQKQRAMLKQNDPEPAKPAPAEPMPVKEEPKPAPAEGEAEAEEDLAQPEDEDDFDMDLFNEAGDEQSGDEEDALKPLRDETK